MLMLKVFIEKMLSDRLYETLTSILFTNEPIYFHEFSSSSLFAAATFFVCSLTTINAMTLCSRTTSWHFHLIYMALVSYLFRFFFAYIFIYIFVNESSLANDKFAVEKFTIKIFSLTLTAIFTSMHLSVVAFIFPLYLHCTRQI